MATMSPLRRRMIENMTDPATRWQRLANNLAARRICREWRKYEPTSCISSAEVFVDAHRSGVRAAVFPRH